MSRRADKSKPTHHSEGLEKAIACFGSLSAMARALGLSGYQVIQEWRRQGRVPAEHCPVVERLTAGAVTCEELNEKVDWAFVRRGTDQQAA
ncbi:transcriptional regulator [Cupriavidus gilardii]|uniref:YdaS family helix-turn-helix protein n=1 Tax=Cupriavidus gilardii TaxID=82541 RepID=UPI001ABED551|nr:YdaS family helix-turn-helix protein [Cupriavidus gilardii]MBO4119869.1 helix-turn-helix domain-containing protein [Cupriavidus gilardii]MCG5259771.1 helix-turn-helix domain-containing protein [Cupriavidus gilardii]MDF9429970.1 transcriptional regulator [Cupriavidus gilardii]